tara:strand:+ start:3488 stop:4084 length:597 start_codon:yes stop_codon:yes gene_type:complete
MIKLSKMTGKLEHIGAINTNTLSNSFCSKMHQAKKNTICNSCYSQNMLKTFRKSCVPAFEHNSQVLQDHIIHDDGLPVINFAYFRFHGHGELINDTHMINFVNICNKNKNTNFALWTKRKDIIKRVLKSHDKPKNLILVYSNPLVDTLLNLPEGFDKVFNVVTTDSKDVNCRGKCIDCLKCYKKSTSTKRNIIIEEIK